MKKIFSLVALLLVFCLLMAGCGTDSTTEKTKSSRKSDAQSSDQSDIQSPNNSDTSDEKDEDTVQDSPVVDSEPIDFTGIEPAPASDFQYLNYPNEGVYILKYLGDDEIVVIPDTIEDTPIICVCFGTCPSLKGVKIPEGVTGIYDRAFFNCYNLTTVELPSTIDTIMGEAFMYTSLTYINLPEGLSFIQGQAFQSTNLTKVVIPSTVEDIWVDAFGHCLYLSEFTILDGDAELSLSSTVLNGVENCVCTIPARVTEFGEDTFGENPTIICPAGSPAEVYAKENGLNYTTN